MEKIRVLYLDDEPFNLLAFKSSFRKNFEILTATTAPEAIGILEKELVHIILSDERMPILTGIEFFESIKDVFPDQVRILLTGYGDLRYLNNAVFSGTIFSYIPKPWDEVDVESAMKGAYDFYLKDKGDKNQNSN